MEINRFIKAQKQCINTVKKELKQRKKRTHWIWFVFPQLRGLGLSEMSYYYGIENLEEAKEYYKNKYLKKNMDKLISIMINYPFNDLFQVFGDTDTRKVCSCMTLFYLATGEKRFKIVIDKFYKGCLDKQTMILLKSRGY